MSKNKKIGSSVESFAGDVDAGAEPANENTGATKNTTAGEVESESKISASIVVAGDKVSIGPFSATLADVLAMTCKNKNLGPFETIASRYFRAKEVKVIVDNEETAGIVRSTLKCEKSHIASITVGTGVREKAERVTVQNLIDTFAEDGFKFVRINRGAAESLGLTVYDSVDSVRSHDFSIGPCWFKGYLVRK